MAIQLEFISLIIPMQIVKDRYPSGWSCYLENNSARLGKTMWYDENLLRAGGAMMDDDMMDSMVAQWMRLGFKATAIVAGKKVLKDLCVVNAFGFSLYPCPWIVVDGAERIAWLRGCDMGDVIGREQFRR